MQPKSSKLKESPLIAVSFECDLYPTGMNISQCVTSAS